MVRTQITSSRVDLAMCQTLVNTDGAQSSAKATPVNHSSASEQRPVQLTAAAHILFTGLIETCEVSVSSGHGKTPRNNQIICDPRKTSTICHGAVSDFAPVVHCPFRIEVGERST